MADRCLSERSCRVGVGAGVLLAVLGSAAFGAGPSVEAFFKKTPDKGAGLPADALYPKGRVLLFSVYSVVSPQVERMKAYGFTAIGPYYGDQDRSGVLDKARACGLPCLYTIGKRIKFVGDKYTMPSDAELRAAVTQTIAKVGRRPEIAIWNVACEELRHWRPDEMRWLRVTTDAIRKADPLRRPIMMYDPNHRNAASLAKTVRFLDFSSKGMYANMCGMKDNRIWIRWGVEQEAEAIRLARRKAIPVSVLWMAKDPKDPAEDELIDDWTRHDVYLSLVSGAKGITVWSGWNRRKGFERTFKKYFEGYAAVAKELSGPLGLGQVFLFGRPCKDIKVTVTSGPRKLAMTYQKVSASYPSISHMDLAYGGHRYLFLVNSAQKTVKANVAGLPGAGVRMQDVLDGGDPTPVKGDRLDVALPALGVKCLRFSRADAE